MRPVFLLFFFWLILSGIFFLAKPLPIDKLFNGFNHTIPQRFSRQTQNPEVTFGLVGDISLGRYITYLARLKNDFSYSFSGFSHILQKNDFNLANLESPIINDCPTGPLDTMVFCGDPQFVPYLSENKFILNLANNHILNYGQSGLIQTQNFLTQNNIGFFNSHYSQTEFFQKEINHLRFGFLGFDLVSFPKFDQTEIINLIKKYHPLVDWLIVSVHWGNEYQPQAENWRVNLAHLMVDAGADIVYGHHPHVIQNIETYHKKPIYYSLGNFIFDQNWSKATSNSEMIKIAVNKNQIINATHIPLTIKNNSRPEPIN